MSGPAQSGFAPSRESLAAESAAPRADREGRRSAWVFVALMTIVIGVACLPLGWYAAAPVPLGLAVVVWRVSRIRAVGRRRRELWRQPFPAETETFFLTRVRPFRQLDGPGRDLFRQRVKLFLDGVAFHGAGVEVGEELRLLAAAAAVVPGLGFAEQLWSNLNEIVFRPEGYDGGRVVDGGGVVTEFEESGLIGVEGVLSGVMMLSAADLVYEFAHPEEGANVGFHEFAHLMVANGDLALAERDRAGWERLIKKQRRLIAQGVSLLDEYALVDENELFAVASELFFTVPSLFRESHPDLYAVLARAYQQSPHLWLGDPVLPDQNFSRRSRKRKG